MARVKIVVVGGGFSGCAAAIVASKAGAEVVLLERTDILTAAGIRAGRMSYNGKLVAAEEAKALGGGEVFEALESIVLHRGNIIGESHGYVYNTSIVEPTVRKVVQAAGVELCMESRAVNVEKEDGFLTAVFLDGGEKVAGDVFVDCTGSFGGVSICTRYGQGCMMCVTYRCPVFGDRVSIATRAGAPELMRKRPDGTPGSLGAAIIVERETIQSELLDEIGKKGAISIPLPQGLIDYDKYQKLGGFRSRQQMEYLNLVDIGSGIKCVGLVYLSLDKLRSIPGFERAMIQDPMGGGKFNNINKVSMTPRDNSLLVKGFNNLFVAGEKCGPGTGIAEVLVTGILAGNNAVRMAAGRELLVLPETTVIGDFIAFIGEKLEAEEGIPQIFSMAHGVYFERMKERGLYNIDSAAVQRRIEDLGLTGVLAQKIV